jgi:hypothetical protein
VGLKLNGTHQLLVDVDDANLLGDNTDTIKKSKEVNAEKTKYMMPSRHQNAGQNHDMRIANRSLQNVAEFRYLGMTVTNQNLIQGEINSGLNSGDTRYHSVRKLSSSRV